MCIELPKKRKENDFIKECVIAKEWSNMNSKIEERLLKEEYFILNISYTYTKLQ